MLGGGGGRVVSSSVPLQQPQPIAEFPEHYYNVRNEDIIRPKPRRLVDMRRSGVGIEHSSLLTADPGPLNLSPIRNNVRSPPILPAKPNSQQLKPLPPRPNSTSAFMLSGRPGNMTSPNSAQPQQAQYQNNAIINGRQSTSNVTLTNFNLNQRSVPNLTHALQQQQQKQRTFLNSGSSSNLTSVPSKSPNHVPYYSDILPAGPTPPAPHQRPRVHGEWKSVDNLPQSLAPRTSNIDFGEGPPKNVNLHLDLINTYGNTALSECSSRSFPEYAKIMKDDDDPLSSPEYDQIRVLPDSPLQQQPKMRTGTIVESKSLVQDSNRTTSFHLHGIMNSVPKVKVTPGVGNGTESTDCSSLGRSSTSDGDFGTLGGDTSGNSKHFIENAGSTPLSRKSRNSGPSSKLKSRRRNILQHLSSEEMRVLSNTSSPPMNNDNIVNNNAVNSGNPRVLTVLTNTGTGGSTSSSEGSSGHASMSDSHTSGSPPAPVADYAKLTGSSMTNYKSVLKSVPEDESGAGSRLLLSPEKATDSGHRSGGSNSGGSSGKKSSRTRNRSKDSLLLGNGNSGLEDIKQAIEQLTLRSYHSGGGSSGGHGRGHHGGHSSYSTSTYSSMSGSECDRHRRPHHPLRHSSLETINTQVTSADEFVWVDSHNRLVELQHFPWSNQDILKVVERSSKLREHLERISMETVPRISYLLQRALVRICRETQRLSKTFAFCTKQEVSSALRIVLSPSLADSCIKACLRAAAMYSVSTHDPLHRDSKSGRAGLNLHVGRFQRWMCEVRLGRYIHEFAAIHLTAGMENLIEEMLGQALSYISAQGTIGSGGSKSGTGNALPVLTAALLEQAIAINGDLWGLLQPFAHLNAGRTASGALALPRWASIASVASSGSSSTTIGGAMEDLSIRAHQHNKSLEQSLLTTCVGSAAELADILSKVSQYHHKQVPISNGSKTIVPAWSPTAVQTLFYFMRCSQLENADEQGNLTSSTATLGAETVDRSAHHLNSESNKVPVQELVYERPFIVLPPLIEWVRVALAHTDHRHAWLVDKDDVMQAARLLLPGIDCPVRLTGSDEFCWPRRPIDEFECNRRLKTDLAFKMLTSGRSDLVSQALLLMLPLKANTFNEFGLSPLILASLRGDEVMVKVLLESGADADLETPPNGTNFPHANNEIQHWTALTFAALLGNVNIAKLLLERGANVEGGAKLSEDKSTQTPLQVVAASGNMEILTLLLNYGANPFLSTLVRDSLCYMGSASRGSFSAISVAASHGQRPLLHKLLIHPINTPPSSKDVLSLEEILAEGLPNPQQASRNGPQNPRSTVEEPKVLNKSQLKVLQEAMYQSAENGHLEITLDLRNMGVPWTLHCWINALSTAHELRCEPVVEQLLQDFLQLLPHEDFSQAHFVEDCLPLLFAIFRNSKVKNEATTLLLADIFQTCYGKDVVKEIRDTTLSNSTRIDPKYVNNPELSDVQFRVEGRVFYAHKIVLVTSSPRFKSMLKGAPETNPPILQIKDIRYHIFQMIMEYLYNGGCESIRTIETDDILELMAAANFFQLDGLLRFCEAKCSTMINIESVVSLYIHAKVYNAVQLLEYCQGFILKNMVSLLTYDDAVRRLIFGKKLHNHDVLAGLLLTFQARLRSKPAQTPAAMANSTSSSASSVLMNRKSK